jgi:Flp pilus assembly pilin Flp
MWQWIRGLRRRGSATLRVACDPEGCATGDAGQDLVEYTLLIGFVALAVIGVFIGSGNSLQGIWTSSSTTIAAANGAVATAAAPPPRGGDRGGDGGGDGGDGGR